MKKLILLTAFIFTAFLTTDSVKAQDGFFSNAKTLQKGVGSIGLQPVFLTNQDDFMFIVRGGYGITNSVTGHLKLGLFEERASNLKEKQRKTIGLVYDTIRKVNQEVGSLISEQFAALEDARTASRNMDNKDEQDD